MIGRMEVTEMLSMAGACAALLVAGFAVETLEGNVSPARALWGAEVEAPALPQVVPLSEGIRLEAQALEAPPVPEPPRVPPSPPSAAEPAHPELLSLSLRRDVSGS